MTDKIDRNITFTSNILFNETLAKGFNRAVIEARTESKVRANQFANAINCLINDGQKDVFVLETKHSAYKPELRLLKNGEVVKSESSSAHTGDNVIKIVTEYVKENFKTNLNTFQKAKDYSVVKNSMLMIDKNLKALKNQFAKNEGITQELDDIQKRMEKINSQTELNSENCVKKLNSIIGDKHYGEML